MHEVSIPPATSTTELSSRLGRANAEAEAAMVRMGTMLSIKAAAQLLRRPIYDVYCAVEEGELTAFQPGGKGSRILIRPVDLEHYVRRSAMPAAGGSLAERLAREAEKRAAG